MLGKPFRGVHSYFLSIARYRSSRSQLFFKIHVLKNFAIFTRKHLCWSPCFFNKVYQNFIKKRCRHSCFPVNIAKFLRTSFFTENLWWLLLFFLNFEHIQHFNLLFLLLTLNMSLVVGKKQIQSQQ